MNSLLLRLLLLAGVATCAGCALLRPDPRSNPALPKGAEAPGVVFIGDSLYLDEAEMANIHWIEYLHFLRTDSSEAVYRAALPDTAVWHQLSFNDPYVPYYLRYPGFRYFPLVGVTQAQAEAYCRWRTAKVAEKMRASPASRRLRKYEVQFIYRLPTAAEWELAARGGLDSARYPYGYQWPPRKVSKYWRVTSQPVCANPVELPATAHIYNNQVNVREQFYYQIAPGQPLVYFRCDSLSGPLVHSSFYLADEMITEYVYGSPPNPYGLFNMIGNVAELTTTPGQAKGGSFNHYMAACRPGSYQPYDRPQMWLGFRCACTIRVRRKAGR